MTDSSHSPPTRSGTASTARFLASFDEPALVMAMAVVPNNYSRNKMFGLFADPRLRRARRRAIALRTAVRQLAGGAECIELTPIATGFRLTYELPRLSYVRRIDLTELEHAAIAFLVERTGSSAIPCRPEDRSIVERTLARLAQAEDPPNRLVGS